MVDNIIIIRCHVNYILLLRRAFIKRAFIIVVHMKILEKDWKFIERLIFNSTMNYKKLQRIRFIGIFISCRKMTISVF